MSISQPRVNWLAYDQFEGTDKAFAESIGMDPGNFAQYKRRHRRDQQPTIVDVPVEVVDLAPTVNGNLPAIPSAHSDAPERISALPVHYDASALDDLTSRLATLEAFVAAMQQAQQRIGVLPAHSDALERITETLAQLDSRLQAVETAPQLSALPAHQDASVHRSAPERTEPPQWKSQGQQFAEDTLQRLDLYARQSRREKREIIDTALRLYLGEVGEAVHDA